MQEKNLSIFEGRKIRKIYDEKQEKWYFSVIDIVGALTEQDDYKKAQSYWTTINYLGASPRGIKVKGADFHL